MLLALPERNAPTLRSVADANGDRAVEHGTLPVGDQVPSELAFGDRVDRERTYQFGRPRKE